MNSCNFSALILADDIAAERGEFHRDLFFGHRITRIAFWNIHAGGVRLATVCCDRYTTWLKLQEKSASNSSFATTFTLSMIGISALSRTRSSLNWSGVTIPSTNPAAMQ